MLERDLALWGCSEFYYIKDIPANPEFLARQSSLLISLLYKFNITCFHFTIFRDSFGMHEKVPVTLFFYSQDLTLMFIIDKSSESCNTFCYGWMEIFFQVVPRICFKEMLLLLDVVEETSPCFQTVAKKITVGTFSLIKFVGL